MNKYKQNGFTLIELIMVMIILGVLAAVAIPRYMDTIENAEEAAEDSGLLPFVSPLTVIALIGLAAVAGNRRTENE